MMSKWRIKNGNTIALFVTLAFVLGNPGSAFAAESFHAKIVTISAYTSFGNGDVILTVDSQPTGCDAGFWLSKSDPGFSSTLSVLLAAFHAKSKISISGDPNQLWGGTTSKYCKIVWVTSE